MTAPGGGEPAPLEGLAMLIGFVVSGVALVLFVVCLVCFPRKIDFTALALSLVNVAAIAGIVPHNTDLQSRQMITVRVLDKNDHPIQGAQVTYQVYGYGPRGTRPSSPSITGGPVETDANGIAILRSRKIRYEILFDVSKTGYLPVHSELGMQFDKYPAPRSLKVQAGENGKPVAGYVSGNDPIVLTLYLPDSADGPRILRYKSLDARFGPSDKTYPYFDFTSGFFRNSPDADLKFEFVDSPKGSKWPRDQKLKITVLRGGGIIEVPAPLTPEHPQLSYNQVAFQAPATGYAETWMQGDESMQGAYLYYRGADGSRYARMAIQPYPSGNGAGLINFAVWINDAGSPDLMDDPSMEH